MRLVSTMLGGGLPSLVSPLLPLLGVDWALDQHNGCIASWFCNKVGLGGILRHGSLCAGFVNVLWSSCPVKGSYHIVKGVSRQTGESCDYGRMVIQRCGLVRFLLPWIWQVLQKLWVVGAIHWKCFCKVAALIVVGNWLGVALTALSWLRNRKMRILCIFPGSLEQNCVLGRTWNHWLGTGVLNLVIVKIAWLERI